MNASENLKNALIDGNEKRALAILDGECPDMRYAEFMEVLSESMLEVGRRFKTGEFFIPEMLVSAQLAGDLYEFFSTRHPEIFNELAIDSGVRIIFGTVQGDIHSIGKDIIVRALSCCGLHIQDVGVNVSLKKFSEAIRESSPDIVMMSAFTTSTRRNLENTVKAIRHEFPGIRIIIGGAAVNRAYSEEIGADGYFENIIEIIEYLRHGI